MEATNCSETHARSPRRRVRWRRGKAAATLLPAAAAAVWLTLRLAGTTALVGPVVVRWQVGLSCSGVTEVRLPPVGTVSAATHRAPLTVSLMAERFQVRSTHELLTALEEHGNTLQTMERDAHGVVRSAAGRIMLLGLLIGLMFGRLAAPRSARRIVATTLLTELFLCLLGGATLLTYDRRAFRQLQFTGVLSEAPQAIELVRRGIADEQRLRLQIRYATTNLARFYEALEKGPAAEEGRLIRILHVSDLHNSVAGLEFMRALARQYRVNEIVCTGDLTDYGTTAENQLLARWAPPAIASARDAPGTLFVMGNHDSSDTLAAVRRLPRALAPADGVVTEAAGLRFVGWADPASHRAGLGSVDTTEPQLAALEARIRAALPLLQPRPDVLLLHNYRVAEALAGAFPVILYGHDHRPRITQRAGSVLIDAGTTGAAGVRYFTVESPPAYSAVLLTFRRDPRPQLLWADLISLRAPDNSFTVGRFRPENDLRK